MPVFNLPSATETAGTVITQVVPRVEGLIARINHLTYTSAGTAHTITVMRATADTTADGRAAAGQKVVTLSNISAMNTVNSSADEDIAASDYLAWVDDEGKIAFDIVASISSSAVTMTVNFTNPIPDGSPVWIFGALARASHLSFSPPASATTVMPLNAQAGIPKQLDSNERSGVGDPILIQSSNGTSAGTIASTSGAYYSPGDVTLS
jgi:hypothetical protein